VTLVIVTYFYSIATVACGNAAMVSTVATLLEVVTLVIVTYFYSIATVACGNAAMVSTVATQRVVIRGSPKPKTFKPLV